MSNFVENTRTKSNSLGLDLKAVLWYDEYTEKGNIDLLNTLFSAKLPLEEKKQILSENYNIAMVKEMESEVSTMCNLSDAIENRGLQKGEAIGLQKGEAIGIKKGEAIGRMEQARATAIRMNKKGLSLEDIAEAIDFNIETVKKWLAPVSA